MCVKRLLKDYSIYKLLMSYSTQKLLMSYLGVFHFLLPEFLASCHFTIIKLHTIFGENLKKDSDQIPIYPKRCGQLSCYILSCRHL